MFNKILGIDLGTTKSVVSVFKNNRPYIIPDKSGNQFIPSLILITPEKEIYAGWDAKKHPKRFQGKNITISSIKRLMGKSGESGWGWLKTYPQEISALILTQLKKQAEQHLNQTFSEAVIAIPSHFDENQRRATKEAAEIAGLKVIRLLNEATAAAVHYGYGKDIEEKILIFDFGGGTLDVSVLEYGENVYEVLSIAGDSKLGGDDFDQIITDFIISQTQVMYGAKILYNHAQKLILKETSEKAKIELSSKNKTTIEIPGFIELNGKYLDLNVKIDRAKFEELSKDLIIRMNSVVKKALKDAKLKPSEINTFLLIGGSSRIPFVINSLKKELKINTSRKIDIETSVAKGAAIMAGLFEGVHEDICLLDVIPQTLSIETVGGVSTQIIARNTTVPTNKSKIFSTADDNQTSIVISINQGDNSVVTENVFLGNVQLTDIPPAPRGIPQIEVTFDVDCDGILKVTAKDLGTGKEQTTVITAPYGLNKTQIKLMKERCDSWWDSQISSHCLIA